MSYGLYYGLPTGLGVVAVWLFGGMKLVAKFLGMVWGMIPPPVRWLILACLACAVYHVLQSPLFLSASTGAICCYVGRGWLDEIEAGLAKLEEQAGLAVASKTKQA